MHFLYWNPQKKDWNKKLFTHSIFCNVNQDFLKKYMKNYLIVDARPKKFFEISHIKDAINLPFNLKWTDESIFNEIKKVKKNYSHNKLIPIIIFCNQNTNDGLKLYKKLNKLEFYNTFHYQNFINK
jgi:hypothetical protein